MPVAVFCVFSLFMFIVPNEVQLPQNVLMIFSGPKEDLEALGGDRRPHEGGTSQPGMPKGLVVPWWLVPPWWVSCPRSLAYKFTYIPKTLGSIPKHFFCRRRSLFRRVPMWSPVSVPYRRGDRSWRASTSFLLLPWWCVSSSPQTYVFVVST